jgi:catechol 2,3-dioxygenase-like lactoylglutathione lyase family enzyme
LENSRFSLILWSTDIPALSHFLAEVAGMDLRELHPGYAELNAGGFWVMVHGDESYRGHPWYDALQQEGVARGIGAELRVEVPDVEEAYRRAVKLGALTLYAPFTEERYTECQVMGPDGYLLSLWAPIDPGT